MTTIYKHVNWIFDSAAFAEMLRDKIRDEDIPAFAQLLGLSDTVVRNWRNNEYYGKGFEHPRMSNFLNVCNILDVDPRIFFGVE